MSEQTIDIMQANLRRIELIGISATLLLHDVSQQRVLRLLANRAKGDVERLPVIVVFSGTSREHAAARAFKDQVTSCGRILIVHQENHNQNVGTALEVFREEIDVTSGAFAAKRRMLMLTRRGGQGKAQFVSPFTAGEGTTCGAWTKPVAYAPNGRPIKGFMKASVAVGFCPVGCPFCYLQSYATEAMEIALNLEDLAGELSDEWRGFPHPINFGETGGLVEMDEWFAGEDGEGSLVQTVIDAGAAARVTPFFLSKVRYPKYLRFKGRVQVGISLMPEALQPQFAPHGSPADELLDSLAWAVSAGAINPVIRMLTLYEQREHYVDLLARCRNLLGQDGWRLTVDLMRFTPSTATKVAKRYPALGVQFARELDPRGANSLSELARAGAGEKKIRPSAERQSEIYRWVRDQLNALGCHDVMVTPCKGDPDELMPLVREGVIHAMPCACYEVAKPLIQLTSRA